QLNQSTRCTAAGHDDRAVVTAPQGIIFVVEPQAVFLLLGSVAGITIRGEKRLNILNEVDGTMKGRWQFQNVQFRRGGGPTINAQQSEKPPGRTAGKCSSPDGGVEEH